VLVGGELISVDGEIFISPVTVTSLAADGPDSGVRNYLSPSSGFGKGGKWSQFACLALEDTMRTISFYF
jgi:uncharacterized membrane protein